MCATSASSSPAAAATAIPGTCTWKTRRCGVCGAGPDGVSGEPLRCAAHVSHPEVPTDLESVDGRTWRQRRLIQADLPPKERDWNPDDPEVAAAENARRAAIGLGPVASGQDGDAGDEWTCEPVDRSGPAAYVHVIRGDGDPEESARGEGTDRRARWGIAPHLKLDATVRGTWTGPILRLLREQPALTFNAISVTLTGLTANVTFETPLDEALWALVDRGLVEHTLRAPIRWRAVSGASDQAVEEPALADDDPDAGAQLGLFR
jgi:hypothetical protein